MAAQQTSTNGQPPVVVRSAGGDEERVRELAVKQIERKRRFHARAFGAAAVTVVLVIIWAIAEYNNAHGWPTNGFSQSSGIYHVWNYWIIYPVIALALGVAIDWWHTFRHRPITEEQIRREMDRLRGVH
jgi:sterol desaturase/sphingolipid hydroxylase (fatty acid hydroxylase superfamily)